ncbi:uncharacterized protein K460DRAFT_408973 [Cucurbitaria berberidis CBS 394.84]|uniref:Uncharacterized protein n=1 Tax=Cucurbitaria berberidis CBS 394.84 TaxID=1168544 RepID=A0A9P4G9U5_9PLEO|nr:uncharacterized protein K460DRAFT_408973 [Cucurbitaria berberidis CBS 394.84]KAF1841511.1 hypothetical protein K460DRAFT_408973 [Cucurbitaria berberidis CBS 394.84]
MLLLDWGKWLLGAIASWESLDLATLPLGGHPLGRHLPPHGAIERVKITSFVLQAPLVVPTVTVTQTKTVGIIATPVVHTPATYPAIPRAAFDAYRYRSSTNGFEASPSSALVQQLSWAQWLLEEKITPLHLILAFLCTPIPFFFGLFVNRVMIRFAHQMIAYHDDQKETRRIDRLTLSAGFFIGKCLFPETFGYGPPEEPLSLRRMWEAVWAELLRPLLLGSGTGFLRMSVAMKDRLGPGLVSSGKLVLRGLGWCTDRLPGRLEAVFRANGCIRIMVIRGIIGLALRFFDWLILSVWSATREVRFERSYKAYLDSHGYDFNIERQRAYYVARTEPIDDSAQRILDYDDIVKRYDDMQSNLEKVTQDAIVNLANKALSYRTSIIELIKIVNWNRCTIAQTINYRHNEKCGRHPTGPLAQFPYTTSQLKFLPLAQNGLHFDIMEYTTAENEIRGADIRYPSNTYLENHTKDGAVYMAYVMENNLVGFYDLFKENSYAIQRNYPGIQLPPYEPHEDPINIANLCPKPILKSELRWKEQIEDFAADGKLLQYGQDQPKKKKTVTFGTDEVRLITPRPQRQAPDPCPRG